MKYVFQIFTGDLSEKSLADPQEIIRKLTKAHKAGKLAGVLCGWTKDKAFYQILGEQLHKWGVPMYLKIAVFSELSGYKEFEPMIDYYGKPMKPYVLNPEESFEFRCPLSQHNRNVLNEIYNESFSDIPFDGIFLDRIRYSSFLSGVAGIGGCFCPECVKRYEAAGIPVDELRQRLIQLEAEKDLQLSAYENGRWILEDPLLQAFFDVKCQIISEALKEYADYFHVLNAGSSLILFVVPVLIAYFLVPFKYKNLVLFISSLFFYFYGEGRRGHARGVGTHKGGRHNLVIGGKSSFLAEKLGIIQTAQGRNSIM